MLSLDFFPAPIFSPCIYSVLTMLANQPPVVNSLAHRDVMH